MTTLPKLPAAEAADMKAVPNPGHAGSEGFGLIESLMAILILALGFMYVGPMMATSIQATTLARSKGTAKLAATNQLEALALKYEADPDDTDLAVGTHTPVQVEIVNPNDSSQVNRYNVGWTVASITDAAGRVLRAARVTVTVTPIRSTGTTANIKVQQNKVINVSTVFSLKSE
jgi:Tfp pilus assembly protein PilV